MDEKISELRKAGDALAAALAPMMNEKNVDHYASAWEINNLNGAVQAITIRNAMNRWNEISAEIGLSE